MSSDEANSLGDTRFYDTGNLAVLTGSGDVKHSGEDGRLGVSKVGYREIV